MEWEKKKKKVKVKVKEKRIVAVSALSKNHLNEQLKMLHVLTSCEAHQFLLSAEKRPNALGKRKRLMEQKKEKKKKK